MTLSQWVEQQSDDLTSSLAEWKRDLAHAMRSASITKDNLQRLLKLRMQTERLQDALNGSKEQVLALAQLAPQSAYLLHYRLKDLSQLSSALQKESADIHRRVDERARRLEALNRADAQAKLITFAVGQAQEVLRLSRQSPPKTSSDYLTLMILSAHPLLKGLFFELAESFINHLAEVDDQVFQSWKQHLSNAPALFFVYAAEMFAKSRRIQEALQDVNNGQQPAVRLQHYIRLGIIHRDKKHRIRSFLAICQLIK